MTKTYEPHAGQDIIDAISRALTLARESGDDVTFAFNDIQLSAIPTDTAENILQRWEEICAQKQAEYLASDEYKQVHEERKKKITQKTIRMSGLMAELARLNFENLDEVLIWLKRYAELADDIGVNYHPDTVLNYFTQAGFKSNENVGFDESAYVDKNIFGRYIVGQAINYLESGMPPHPIIIDFISQWSK